MTRFDRCMKRTLEFAILAGYASVIIWADTGKTAKPFTYVIVVLAAITIGYFAARIYRVRKTAITTTMDKTVALFFAGAIAVVVGMGIFDLAHGTAQTHHVTALMIGPYVSFSITMLCAVTYFAPRLNGVCR